MTELTQYLKLEPELLQVVTANSVVGVRKLQKKRVGLISLTQLVSPFPHLRPASSLKNEISLSPL